MYSTFQVGCQGKVCSSKQPMTITDKEDHSGFLRLPIFINMSNSSSTSGGN